VPFYCVINNSVARPNYGQSPVPLVAQQVWATRPDGTGITSVGGNQTVYHADYTSPFVPASIPPGSFVYLDQSVNGRFWIAHAPGWDTVLSSAAMRDQPGCRDF